MGRVGSAVLKISRVASDQMSTSYTQSRVGSGHAVVSGHPGRTRPDPRRENQTVKNLVPFVMNRDYFVVRSENICDV